MKKMILLSALFGLLAGVAPVMSQGGFMPKEAVVAVKISSYNKMNSIIEKAGELSGQEMGSTTLPIEEIHSMKGVDLKKPFYVFLSAPSMAPMFAMPLTSADEFVAGVKYPGFKPQVCDGHGLLALGGSIPALGGKGLSGMPGGDVAVRVFGVTAMKSFGPMLSQYKMLVGMMAMSLGQEKAKAASQLYDLVVELLGQVKTIDLTLVDGKEMEFGLGIVPLPGTDLAKATKTVSTCALPAGFNANTLMWFCNRINIKDGVPAIFTKLGKLLRAVNGEEQGDDKAKPLGGILCGNFDLVPGAGLVGMAAWAVGDQKAMTTALSSKEGILAMLKTYLPQSGQASPMGGMGGVDPEQITEMLTMFLNKMNYVPNALEVGEISLQKMSINVNELVNLVAEGDKEALATMTKLAGGEMFDMWLGIKGKNLLCVYGPQEHAAKIFGSQGSQTTPAFASNSLICAKISMGSILSIGSKMGLFPLPATTGKDAKKASIPEGRIRFAIARTSKGFRLKIIANAEELKQIGKLVE